MAELFPFFIILFAGVFFSELFNRLHLPWVVALILGGIIIGPFGMDLISPHNQTIDFLSQIGLVFVMFMAGLEVQLDSFKQGWKNIQTIAVFNGFIPFLAGVGLGLFFGYSWTTAFLLGVIFISSSVAVVIPSLESNNILNSRIGKSIISSTVFQDVVSLVLLSLLFQSADPITVLPLPVFYALLFAFILFLLWIIPRIRKFIQKRIAYGKDKFQEELRSIFVILIGIVVVFEILGLHPIIAGFFAGFVLSDSVKSEALIEKLRVISYGMFIPIFFVVVGARTDISVFFTAANTAWAVLAIVLTSLVTKFTSGWIGGRLSGFTDNESALIGGASTAQLSTTLAVAYSGLQFGFIPQELVTALVSLSVVTTFVAPLLVRLFARREHQKVSGGIL